MVTADIESLVLAVDVEGVAGCALWTFVSFLVGEARVGNKIVVGRASECLWGMSYSHSLVVVLVMNSDGSLPFNQLH